MKASRKDFEAMASELKRHRKALDKCSADNCDNAIDLEMNEHVQRIADILQRANGAFDRARFVRATS